MEPPALAAGPAAPVRAAPGASADLVLPPPKGTQPFTYRWSRAGASLDDRFTTSDDAGGVRLTVSAAQTGDSGVYTLQASNAAGSDTSKIRLEVAAEEAPIGEDPPTFLRRLQDLTVKVGSRTRFLVEIISSTECKVTWYRNERRLLEAERVALARDGNFWCADVAAVSVDDAGRWTCTAENAGGRASCSAHLNVLVPKAYKRPEFVEELRALLTEQGTVSLECKVIGVPTPVLRWFKDSREIKAGDVFALTANAEDPTSLGTYTCEAVNCMGRAYSSSKVHVVGRASREGSARPSSSGLTPEPPPIFTKELEDAHVKVCEHLTLGCHIVVPPWPRSVVWYNKEGKVEPGERYHVLEDGVGGYLLEIPVAEWADEGEWKCVATSAGSRVGISTCYVTMDVPKNYRKPRFMENLQAVLTEEGLVSFECKVVGFPTPVLSWFKDGQELKPGDVYQLTGTNSLGSYCCIARNCMGQASSSAELTVEDIQNQLNEEEKLQLFSKNQAPKFLQGLKSVEAKIDEPFRFTVRVAIPPEPSVLWYRDDQPVDESTRCHLEKEDKGLFNLDLQNLEFLDQAEWKCVAMNDFGHSVTSCFLKLIIPRHYKKPRFLENLQAILSDEGAVNLECKVIGVPQPVLKWYKDGEELKPGDIHRIISGQDGTCCLGTYTCEAQNCMGIAASSASLLGFDDSIKTKTKTLEETPLQRNLSLSTIHEERTSQMYDTPVGDITLDDKGEISFSFDGKEVSVSLYETPDLTEEEALQIVEMYADQLSENVTEHNVVELPPLRFVKETSTSGNLLMEAIIIDVSPDYFAAPEEDLRTEADVEDLSIADENGLPQLSLDQDIDIGGEDYLEKTMALLSEEKSDFAAKSSRRKSDSQRSADDFYSLSRDQSLSEEKKDDDTHVSESELQSFASARSSAKVKSKSSKPSDKDGLESSEPTKTILLKEDSISMPIITKNPEKELEVPAIKPKRERRTSRGSRRSSTSSEKSIGKSREELLRFKTDHEVTKPSMNVEEFKNTMITISTSLTKVINDVQLIERDIILKSELMSSAATASRSLEIISSLITPLSEINSIADASKESVSEPREVTSTIFNSIPQSLKSLQQSLTLIEKCIDMESDNKTLVKKTCVAFIEACGAEIQKVISDITTVASKNYIKLDDKVTNEIDTVGNEMISVIKFSVETIRARNLLNEASEIKHEKPTLETKHLRDTQKALFELKSPLNSLLRIVEGAKSGNIIHLSKTKQSEIIMNDMSSSIQDLQTALEQIETLSVKESSTTLHKYNTEIIETVMDSILKLRGSFEQLSTNPNTEEDKAVLQETLSSLKENLTEISCKIKTIDNNVGQFDILQSENKLDVLQKMAQILIALENNLPRLETIHNVKSHMDTFHKNMTKVLENVIESNDAKKYLTMMEICDNINIINSSIKNIDTDNVLLFGSLSNTLKIIQTNLDENVFEPELNCFIKNNISAVLVGIQEAINKAEEVSLQADSEYTRDWSTQIIDEAKVHIVLEHIDQTIAAVNTIKTIESTQELKLALKPAFENICPILEELRRSVASIQPSGVEQDEHISEIADITFAETLGTPLCELNQNIIVLNQLIVENIDYIKDSTEVITAIAVPLQELHTTLEILQQDVISQYGEDLISYEVSVNMASVVQNLQSCIVLVHEPMGIEGAEEMSTLEDISGIKTSADTLPSDRLVLPAAEETAIEQSLLPLTHVIATTATAQTLHTLNEHIMVFQTPEIIEALDTLSEISNYSSLKSVIVGLGDLHSSIDGILHPVLIEDSIDLENTTNISKLAAIAEPLQEIHQSLSILDTCNIPVCENILDLPAEKINSVFQNISELKDSLEQCMGVVLPAMEIASNTIEISNKVSTLREVCKHLNEIFTTSKDVPSDFILPMEYQNLEIVVNSLIDATDTSKDIKIDQVKCITEELYLKVMGIQDEIVQYTTQSPLMVSQEAKLIQTVSEVEANIAVLEQYDFIDLSRTSDITSYMSSQKAIEIDSESLAQIHEIAEDAVNVLQNHHQEIPMADLMIVDDFFKTCKNEFTILRCLISKAPTHKKIIRLLQEFKSLQTLINSFTTKRLELCLSDDINECLTNFLIHADECLRNARTSLVKVVDAQSVMLIKSPITVLESIRELTFEPEYKSSSAVDSVVKSMQGVANISKYLSNNLQCAIIEELSQPNQISTIEQEEKVLTEIIEHLTIVVDSQLESENFDDSSSKVFDKLKKSIIHHQGYKDALGTGKTLIILKCLAECATIVQEDVTGKKMYINETKDIKENSLKEVLAEMLQPLQALQTQLISIQEEVLSGAEEDSISIDITTTESIMQTVTELHKDIVQQIEMDKLALCNEEISLIEEVDKEIHTIQDSIRSMENVQATQVVKEITKPMNEIEKSLHNIILSAETDRKTLSKDASDDLLRHIDQYIELIEIVESISASIKVDDVKESFDIARELKINIINCENNMNEEMLKQAYAEQTRLAQKLQTALSAFQVQVLDSAQELAPILSANDLQRIAQATAQLQANIVAVTSIQVPVQVLSPKTTKPLETAQEPLVSATTSEYLVADTNEFNKIPTSYKGIPVEHVTATTISFETAAIVASQEVLEAERAERVEQKGSDSVAISFETAAIMASQEVLDAERVERVEQQGSDSVASTVSTQKQHHIEKTSDPKTSEVETASIISDASEIITETKVETVETYLENVVGSQGLNESQLPIDKVKALPTVQENLMQHIIEYVSDDIIEVLNKVSSIKIAEELQNSVNIAKELQKCIVAIGTGTKENIVCETKDQYEIQKGLAVSLVEALSILTDDTLEQLHELIPSANEDTVEKIVTVIDIIKTDLSKIVPLYEEHLLIRVDQQELRAQLETTPLLKEDLADTLDQAISEDSRNLILVENTFEALVSLVPIRPSEALAETIDVDHEKVIKDVATEHLVSTETQQTIAKEHTEFFMLEETKHTLPSRDDEDEVNVLEQIPANKIFNICQQATSVEGISVDAILTQEISSYQRNQETCSTTVEATEVNVEMSVNEASKEVVNIEAAQFDLPAVTDEKKTEDLIAKDELIVDSLEAVASDIKDNATVGIETAFISQSTEYIDGAIDMSQMSQETDKSAETIPEATKATLQVVKLTATNGLMTIDEVEGSEPTEGEGFTCFLVASSSEVDQSLFEITILQEKKLKDNIAVCLNALHDVTAESKQKSAAQPRTMQSPSVLIGDLVETMNQDSIAQLETLLRDVNFKINFAPVDIITDSDNSESLKDTLDEVQTVIIKLKREYDGDANDFLNETLEDLECSVRSVQLQINEESSPQLLTEACATLQLLVDNMNTTQQVQVNQGSLKPESTENILKKCSNETHDTVKLLDLASKLDTKGGTNLTSIIANLKTIKDSIISLRECFLVDADTVIENGIKIIECLNQVEENIFSLERDIDIAENITVSTRDIIVTAVHSVYGSISNMRSAVSSLQKQFMFENYGKPSESLLHSIKHIAIVSSSDDENNKPSWKRLSKSLRKVLNHFEDIKFYINLDKTARLPSDAAFTKIILEELRANIFAILVPRATLINSDVVQTVNGLLKCVDDNFISIESDSSLQVKNKIPMFKNIATKILTTITLFKNHFANPIDIKIKTTEESIPDIKMVKDQELQEMAVTAVEHQRASTTSVDANMRTTTVSDEVKTIKGSNLPSTSDSVTDEISNTLVSLSSAVEISNPLIKHALLVEDNAERYISEMIVSPEMTSLSVHLEKSQAMQFEQNEEDSIIQSMETKQIILSQSVLETSGSHDMTLQASTSKPLDNSTVDKVTDVELLSQTELKAVDKMEQSETDKIGLTIQVMEIDQPTQSQSVSEISGSHDVIFQTTTNKQGDERTIDVVMDVESPIETEQYVVEKIEQSEADKEDSTIQLMEIEPPAQLQSVLETRDSHDETLPATTKIQENNEMVDKTTGQEPPTETEQKVMEKMKQSEVDRTDSTIQSLVIEQPTESQSDLETSGSLEVTLQTTPSKQEDNSKVNMATDVGSPTETELNVVNKINESEADKEGSTVQSMEIEQPAQSQSILETRGSHNESLHATSDIQEDKGEEPPTEKEQKLVEKMKQLEVVKKDSTIQSLEIEEPTQSQSGLETDVKSPTETELNDVNKINQSEADKEGSTVQLMEIEKPAQSQSILETRGSHNESLHATSDIQEDKGEEPPTEKEQKLVEKMKQLEVDKKDSTIKSLEIAEPTQSQSDSETDVKSPTETELNDVNKINQSEADKEGSTVQSMEIEQPAQSQSVLETKSSHDDTLHATIEIQENNKMVDKTTGEEPPTETEKKVVEKNKQLEVDKKDSTLQSLEIEQPTQSQSDLETSGSLDVTLQTTTNKQTDNRKVNMATDVGSPTETELNVVNKLNESEADKEGSTVQSMEIEQPAQSQSVLETRGSRDETLHAASDIQEANKMVDKTLGEEPPTETEQEVVEKVEQLKADKEDSTIQSMDIEQFTQSQSALDTSGSENVILQETTSKQEDNKMVEKVTDVKSLTETKQIIVESEVLAKAEIGGAHDVQVKYDLESSEMPKNNKTTKKEISSSENELRNDEYSLSKANSESGYIDQSEKNVIEEICSSNIQAETELRIEKKYESGTKQLLEDAIKVNQKTVVKENLEVRVKEEKDDVRSKPKEDNEARYIMEQEKSFKTKQNVKENEEKASALKEKTDCDPKSNEEEIPSNSKKPAKKDTQIMEAADKVLHVNELKPKNEEVQYKQEKEKNKTKANQDHEGDVIKEKKETEAKAHNDAELKHTEEKTHALKEIKQQESREAEKEMEKGKLIQDEETRINQKNNDAKLQQEPEDKTCGIIKDEDAKARPKNDAELQQKKETSALKEKVEDDLKTNENQEAQHDMKEKVKKTKRVNVEADKVKEKTVLKLKKDEASSMEAIHQEKDDAETKQQHDEETRVLVEEQKSSKQKQDAEFQQKGDDTCTLKDADRDAYLNKTLEHEVLIGKEKADKVKNVRNEADRANQRIELEEKETSLNQENDDVDLKKKQIDNARAIKEQKDIDSIAKNDANLKHSEKETCVLKEKAQQDSEEAKTVTEEAKIKQINDDCRSNQENNDTELKHKQEDKAHAVKEIEEAKAKEKNDVELKQKEETCGLKEKADGDLKAKEELKASNKKERGINAKKNKEEADKLKQKTELKLKKEEAPPIEDILSKEDDAEAKQKEDEKTRVTSQEKTPSKAKQDAELKEKEDKSPELEKNADADLKITVEYEALIEKEIAENASKVQDIADKSKQQTEVEEKETRLKQENDVDFKEKQADKEHAFKEQEEVDTITKNDAKLNHSEKETYVLKEEVQQDSDEAKTVKEEAKIKQINDECRGNQENNDAEVKHKQKDKARAVTEINEAKPIEKNDAELKPKEEICAVKEKADFDLKEEQEAPEKKEKGIKAKKIKENGDKKVQETKTIHEIHALKENADDDFKQTVEHEALIEKEMLAQNAKKVQDNADKVKQQTEANETCLKQEKDDVDIKEKQAYQAHVIKLEEEIDAKTKNDHKLKHAEEESRVLKEKVEEETKLKLIKQETDVNEEIDNAKLKQKQEDKTRVIKEEKEANSYAKSDAELKQKEEEALALKEIEDENFKKQEERNKKEKAKKFKKVKDADKVNQRAEIKQTEDKAHILKETDDTKMKQQQEAEKQATIAKQAVELKQKEEACMKKEKADAYYNKKIDIETSMESMQKPEEKSRLQNENTRKAINEADNVEMVEKYQEKIEVKHKHDKEEHFMRENKEEELKQKQVKTARVKNANETQNYTQHTSEKNEPKNDIPQIEHKEVISSDVKETKKISVDEISKKTSKYTERLGKSERRDDELHIYKEDSHRQAKKTNSGINHNNIREVNQEQRYIKEYQYEPLQTQRHNVEAREKPRFVDHNHRDYTMEFARPSGYRERSFELVKPDNLPLRDHLGRNNAIYKAQTLVLDSQLRSSSSSFLDPNSSRTSEPIDRHSEIRHQPKAHSEARIIHSDKRTGLSRDSKRKPVFSTYLTDRTAVEGSRVKLTCSVLSSSDPTVTWYKNGVLLDNKLKYKTKLMDGLITLEVLNAVPSDSAEYGCTIQNENGSVSSSANLKVYPCFEASPIPPTFTRSIRDTFHIAENELVLECRIRGQPLPTITWLKDDKSISTNSRYQAYYLADGVCRLAIEHPTPDDSGKYTCKAENSVWSDQITHVVNFTGRESRLGPNIATLEKSRFNRQALESRRPHFTNVLSDYKVVTGGTIGLQVEIRGAPTRVEWLREGCPVTEVYRNAKTFVEHGLYTLALSDVTEKESGMYTCRAWSSQSHVDMNAAITVVQPNELDGKPAIIVGRPEKNILISVGEDVNISFRVQGDPKPKVIFMKGIRDITTSQRACKMTSDDYVKFTLKRSVVSDAGTYCILARNAYGCDRAFVTVVVRQRASSDNLISDWTYPADDSALSLDERKFKSVPERIPGEPCVVEGGNNWISLGWPKSEPGLSAPVLAYKVESWLLGKDGGARWVELGITPLNSFDAFNLKQGEEYHFRVTPRNRYGWGESVQTLSPNRVGLAGDRPEFSESLPGQLKVLVGETANLSCSVKGKPAPELVWMKNGHEIDDEDRRISSCFNGINCSLTIKDINIEDEARYSCEATNVHGRASTYARLAVVTDRSIWEADAKLKRERSADVEGDYPPQFTMRLRDRRVQATYPVRLTCQVIGSPDPCITWFKDGGQVEPDNRRSHFQDEHFHTLELAPTTLEDGGVYEAMARNNSGAVSCRCNLVVDKGIRAYVAPEFCCGLEPLYRLTDGEELRISAVVEAYPSVGVTWYRDGVRLRPSRRAIMTLDRDGQIELALAAVTSRDAGVYSCTASNEVGRASTSGKVEVTGTHVMRTPPVLISPDEPYSKEPMFIRKPRSSEAREGDTVIIACEVVGDPKPDVYWLRDFLKPDYYRDSSHFKRMGDGPEYRFEIPHAKLDYTGAYSVVARNAHGEAKAIISLQILAKDLNACDEAHNVSYGRVEVLPRFSKDLTDLLSCDGDAVEFECLLSGHPEPHVRWFHYHELLRDCSDFETSFDEGTARLKIKQVTADDEGTYTCEAVNNLGKTTSSACLVVYPPGEPNTLSQRLRRPPAFLSAASTPRSTPRSTPARSVSRTPGPESRRLCSPARTLAPAFYTYPFNKVAEEGDSVSLQCAIKGNPAPWATWDKDGVIITPSSRITIKEKDEVLRVLEIDQVTIDDVGVYRITIENEFGRQEASARIEVITQKGKFYAGVRAVSPSPRKSLTYRGRRPSTPRQD